MNDREKVVKGLEHCTRPTEYGKGGNHCMDCPYTEAIGFNQFKCNGQQMMKDALALLKEHGWIPVTERLPKSMANKVIVYVQHDDYVGYIGYGHYEKYKGQEMWFDLEHYEEFSKRGYHVTHWMETPMPPMEGW